MTNENKPRILGPFAQLGFLPAPVYLAPHSPNSQEIS